MARRPPRSIVKVVTAFARLLYRASGGKLGGIPGTPVLLLTTKGRRTGKPRTTPLLYLTEGESLVVVASFGGSDVHPAWFLNLEADPDAEVQIGRSARRQMRARRATAEERAGLWPRLTELYPGYAKYKRKTSREIPLVILERVR